MKFKMIKNTELIIENSSENFNKIHINCISFLYATEYNNKTENCNPKDY